MNLRLARILLIVFVCCIIAITARADGRKVHGVVIDKVTREPIESAMVTDGQANNVEITDKNGKFVLSNVKVDSLYISVIGYDAEYIKIGADSKVSAELHKGAIMLKDVTVTNSANLKTYHNLTSLDLNMQPVKSAQDLLRLVPGLFIAQHQGGGKAEQIFLRGFDADHGTDVNVSVDGLPVNMVTHAHGQGYADLHFVIPETIASYDFGKGPYYTDKGDFTTAGYVAYSTKNVLDRNMIKIEAGQFNSFRAVALINLLSDKARKKGTSAYIAGEGLYSDGGPFTVPQHFTRYNLFGKFITKVGTDSKFTFIASTLSSGWRAAGEIPERAISEGYIANHFGALDSSQGGYTSRTNISGKLTTDLGSGWTLDNQLWYSHYYFNLVSNFSYYLYYPTVGDEFRQKDNRDVYGYTGKISKLAYVNNTSFTTTLGAGLRYDNITPNALEHTEDGNFISYLQYGKARELNTNGYLDETIRSGKWLFNAGIRVDYFHFYYQNMATPIDAYSEIGLAPFTNVDPNANKVIASPKVSAEYTFNSKFQMYLKGGKGFHSNDARVVIANKDFEILPAAYGADLGMNWKPLPNLYINTAIWYLYLQQEFTFGSDLIDQPGGPVSLSGRTQREGIDFSARYQITNWLFFNFNINPDKPRYLDSAKGHDHVELAPTLTSTAGLDFRFKNGINGGISYRYLHDRAADPEYTHTASGYFITDLTINYTRKRYELGLAIENLFNQKWDEAQFEYESRLKNEAPGSSVTEVSFTPGVPFFAKFKLSIFF